MSRYGVNKSYSHYIQKFSNDWFRICWTSDRYKRGNRLRWPTQCTRDTDLKGAMKFAKRHNLEMPA